MIKLNCLAISHAFIFISLSSNAAADGKLPIRNDTGHAARLYVKSEHDPSRLFRYCLFVPAEETRYLPYKDGVRYLMVAVDYRRRQCPVGFVDISKEVNNHPEVEFLLSHVVEAGAHEIRLWDSRRGCWVRRVVADNTPKFLADFAYPVPSQ
jgi:hypothetical protein